jgi:DNA modification methylase
VRELYPHLIAKRQQARILCGCPPSGERAEAAHAALIALHRTGESDVDFPEPASMFTPGWYLRSDIIWSKCNPMPESVTDRPTKAHEYLFLLTKSERYYYDADAIKEPYSESTLREFAEGYNGNALKDYEGAGVQNPSDIKTRIITNARKRNSWRFTGTRAEGMAVNPSGNEGKPYDEQIVRGDGRNKRSVWHIATQPYPDAHFATYPEALIKPCILAGSKVGDTVLDPFNGSGTTGAVAVRLQRNYIGIELNADYIALARRRIGSVAPLFAQEHTA